MNEKISELAIGQDGTVSKKIDGVSVILSIRVKSVNGNYFSAELLGVVDEQSGNSILSGAGYPSFRELESIPLVEFNTILK